MVRPAGQLTHNRRVILEEIGGRADHPTANEILMAVRRRSPGIAYASVYNALKFLTGAGHVREFHCGDNIARYDRNIDRHDHAICTKCGKLVDTIVEFSEDVARAAAAAAGFELQTHHVELYGLCEKCR
jgi:Fe2+ or Zn2+ uptake regulation protein